MTCEEFRDCLVDYVMGHMDDAQTGARMEEHLASCEECRRETAETRRIGKTAREATHIRRVNQIIVDAFEQGASHIHLISSPDGSMVAFRVGGRLRRHSDIEDAGVAEIIAARLKQMSGVPLTTETGKGTIPIRYAGAEVMVRTSFFKTARGTGAVLQLTEPAQNITLEDAGFCRQEIELVRSVLERRPGLVVLLGESRSTRLALASYLSMGGGRAVYDIEQFTPRPIGGIRSIKAEGDLPALIRRVLDYDPDALSIAAVDDVGDIPQAIRFALGGHWVIVETPFAEAERLMRGDLAADVARALRLTVRHETASRREGGRENTIDLFELGSTEGERKTVLSFSDSADIRISEGTLDRDEADRALAQIVGPYASRALSPYLEAAKALAGEGGNAFAGTDDIAAAIIEDRDTGIYNACLATGVEQGKLDELIREMRSLSRRPEAAPIDPDRVGMTPRAADTIKAAGAIAYDEGAREVTPRHLVRAMLSDDGIASRYLDALGVTLASLEEALAKSE